MTRAVHAAAIALCLTSGAASAAVPAKLKAPTPPAVGTTPVAPTAPAFAATQAPPKGIPGYYDPASRTFAPLAMTTPAGQPTSVKWAAKVTTYYGSPPGQGPSLFIDALFNFGALGPGAASPNSPASSSFVVQQYNSASADYPAGPSSESFSASSVTSYQYVQIRINCNYSSSTVSYATSVFVAQQAVTSGTVPVDATCNL